MSSVDENTQSTKDASSDVPVSLPIPTSHSTSNGENLTREFNANVDVSKSKSKTKADVWNHFHILSFVNPSDRKATCKYCEKTLACSSANGSSCS